MHLHVNYSFAISLALAASTKAALSRLIYRTPPQLHLTAINDVFISTLPHLYKSILMLKKVITVLQ